MMLSKQIFNSCLMKLKHIIIAAAVLFGLASCRDSRVNISIFSDHIATIASQEGISYRDAAKKVRDLGYDGVDVWTTINPEQLHILDSLGFRHSCAIAYIDFCNGAQEEVAEQAIDFMNDEKWDKLLLVPGLMQENASKEDTGHAIERVASFVQKASDAGLKILVEDYDNSRSICFNTVRLDSLFNAAESLGLVFDTGNWSVCGEDEMAALEHFKPIISHIHLKDRKYDGSCPAVGDGIIPIRGIISKMLASGYNGWFTVEHFGSQNMYEDAARSIRTIKAASK